MRRRLRQHTCCKAVHVRLPLAVQMQPNPRTIAFESFPPYYLLGFSARRRESSASAAFLYILICLPARDSQTILDDSEEILRQVRCLITSFRGEAIRKVHDSPAEGLNYYFYYFCYFYYFYSLTRDEGTSNRHKLHWNSQGVHHRSACFKHGSTRTMMICGRETMSMHADSLLALETSPKLTTDAGATVDISVE